MKNEPLNDQEHSDLMGIVQRNPESIGVYVNKLLAKRALGDDHCARPLSFRDKDDVMEPCFAAGYLKKIIEYIDAVAARKTDGYYTTIREAELAQAGEIKGFVINLHKEIKTFFCLKKQ